MDRDDAARIAHYQRWLRPDWRRWLHPDWERFVHPAQREAMRKDFALRDRAFETPLARRWREEQEARERDEQERLEAEHQAEIERQARQLKAELASLRLELAMRRKEWEAECAERKLRADIAWERFKAAFMRGDFAPRQKANFNPNQQRVAAGHGIESGRWADEGDNQVRLAASDKVRIGPVAAARLAYQVAKRLIDAYRSENSLNDLFDRKRGAVSVTTIDGKDIYGTNRGSRYYDRFDEQDWRRLRDTLVEKHPDLGSQDNLGEMPLNALTHAETNVLLRAARENGGSLAGRNLEVFTDKRMCNFCPEILPHVGVELGDPTVTFVGPDLKPRTMKGGVWINTD